MTKLIRPALAALVLLAAIAVVAPAAGGDPATADLVEHGAWLDANPAIADAMANPIIPELPAKTAQVARPGHQNGPWTADTCRYIEALRFGLNPNGVYYSHCQNVHWCFGTCQHQVVMRFTGATSGSYFCVAWDHRGYDGDGVAFGYNDGCPYVSGGYSG
jgi:hypothetical protein